ncbi:MAG TPA: hypothetical protein VN598_13615 [Usitatibacter sp.]|nr:hypothetical protein [Usitatibacter sp.]HXS51182.1 hypothetical protein [Usitatibacter sp.]
MRTPTWQERLDICRTEREIVEVSRNYLASFDHFEISRLPDPCKPTRLVCGVDVSHYALALATQASDETDRNAELIHRLAAFFIQAHMKLARLGETTNDGEDRKQSA